MIDFEFETDEKGYEFCKRVVRTMVEDLEIVAEEALGRINRAWRGKPLVGDENVVYHETPEYWAKTIYYGKDSKWWLGEEGLRPLPYP